MVPACAGFAGVNAGRDCQAHRVGGARRCVFCDRTMGAAVQYVSPRPAPKHSRRKRSSPPPLPNIKFPKVY